MTTPLHSQLKFHHRYQLLEPLPGVGLSALPLPHAINMAAGVAASSYRLNSMVWPLPWDGVVVAFSGLTPAF